jgi:hypothetical protein
VAEALTAAPTATDHWFARQAARDARVVLLEEALLAGRTGRYAWYRLRGFGASWLVECATQAVLALVALRALPAADVVLVVAAHAAVTLVAHLWWGALEALRGRIRELHRTARPHRVPAVIGGWLTAGAVLGAVTVAVLIAAVALRWVLGGVPGPGEAYVAVLALGLALELPLRAYHSGVYATRRIRRPLAATFVPPLLGTATLLAAAPMLGPWALAVSAVVTTLLSAALTLRFTRRMYRFLGLAPGAHLGRAPLVAALRGRVREAAAAGAANGVIGVDALLALWLLTGARQEPAAVIALFLALPTLTACADWARLLYFDLKKLELRLFTDLRRRFDRATAGLAVLLGLGFGVVAAGLALLVGRAGVPVAAATAGFVLARSVLAHGQIRAFVARAYRTVVVVGLAGALGFLVIRTATVDETARLAGAAAVAALCAAALARAAGRDLEGRPAALPTLEWLRTLGGVREPVRIGTAVLSAAPGSGRLAPQAREDAARWRLAGLADQLARRIGAAGAAAWLGPDTVVWLERPGAPRVTAAWLQRTGGGLVRSISIAEHADGEEALLRTAQVGGLGRAGLHLRAALAPVDVDAAVRRFTATVPGGMVLDPGRRPPPALAGLPGTELAAVLADAAAFARDLQVRRHRSRYDVTPLCSGGELVRIFVMPPGIGAPARRRWHARVRALNVRAAVAGLRPSPTRARTTGPAATDPRVAALRRSTLFGGLPTRTLTELARVTGERRIAAGTPVVVENEIGVGFFLIADGRADVVVDGTRVAGLGPGDHFGDIALVAGTARTATVVAATDLRCLTVTSWDFRRLVESDPEISWRVLSAMAAQLLPRIGVPAETGRPPVAGPTRPR